MRIKKFRYFVGDFETTVYTGQEHTEVWASAITELYQDTVEIFHSIDETFNYLIKLKQNCIIYYHNLKFDGSFWLPFLMCKLKLSQAIEGTGNGRRFLKDKDMPNNSFKYSISERGQWYTIIIKIHNCIIEIRDSYKLLPFAVKRIGKSFNTKHQKLDMEYAGFRFAGCEITPQEREYIANDVLVVKEALEIMFNQGHDKLTIGSCCFQEYKNIISDDWDMFFPDLININVPEEIYYIGQDGKNFYKNADEYIRRSYRGGWCYVVKGKENKLKYNGVTADVNSLYPSVMHSESGNRYPIGKPCFWTGNFIPDKALHENRYYFLRIKTRFYIKENKLPFIQIKNSYLYKGTECLETSDIKNTIDGKLYPFYKAKDGQVKDTRVILTLTMTDYKLMLEHYELVDFEILDGCWFYSEIGIFDEYINKYRKIKMESKGAVRECAKLFLNNLYGKMASSTDSSFKLAFIKSDGLIGFENIPANDKTAGYIAVGSAITSYAREFTIRTAQKNYCGVNKAGFCYADTDSIHCDLPAEKLVGVPVHDTAFCHWKLESYWDIAIFTRQKTYIEHVTHEDGEKVEKPYYNVKCAGMPEKCKRYFIDDVLKGDKELTDFKVGLEVTGKLLPKRISGGIVLQETSYKMH